MTSNKLRDWLYLNLDPAAWPDAGLSPLNRAIVLVVLASVAAVILETEQTIAEPLAPYFRALNIAFALLFTIEYAARFWVVGKNPHFRGLRGRLRFVFNMWSLFDLLAIVLFYLSPFLGALGISGSDAFLLRIARLVRIFSIARLGKLGQALSGLRQSVYQRRFELYVTVAAAGLLLLTSSTVMYYFEREAQPDAFGSIPRALWWGVATLTTVGYGDVYPITVAGKICAAVIAIAGIGLIAMPTGILAAAFSEAFQKRSH